MAMMRGGAMSTSMSQSSRRVPRPPENMVHADRFRREMIRKELESLQLYTNFTINPYRPGATVTGKPNSLYDAICDCGPEDETMSEILKIARRVPTEKYDSPQTSSQEYGWYSRPLLDDADKAEVRTGHHARHGTEVTRAKEMEWKSGLSQPESGNNNGRSLSRRSKHDGASTY